jgi:hypothetical protein
VKTSNSLTAEANQTNQTTPTTSDITGSMTIPFDQTICDQLSKLKDMSSPTQTNDLLQLESSETNTPVASNMLDRPEDASEV